MKVHAILLAAGSASRFGGRKLLAPLGGGTVLAASLKAARSAPVLSVIVVTGVDAEAVRAEALKTNEIRLGAPLRVVHAPDAVEGVAASLRTGVASLPADADAALIFLGDMPRVPEEVAADLIAAADEGSILAAAPVFQGMRGHPVLMKRSLFPALLALRGDRGAGPLLADLGDRLALVPARTDGVLVDIDTAADLAALSSR